ncbi:hypothetical protein Pint_33995 [Pistacia integerrima]|uniref:Uncharacterized protein n=1 Tax=Pistacia integerrima TaxID=434235 RepID=A0ACC0X482_9ROSI|nr:hypothetical protein Pint_33995 [Pistacia integerrima]
MSAALQPPPPSQTVVTLADPLPPPLSVKISQYFSESIESQRRRHASPEPYGDVVSYLLVIRFICITLNDKLMSRGRELEGHGGAGPLWYWLLKYGSLGLLDTEECGILCCSFWECAAFLQLAGSEAESLLEVRWCDSGAFSADFCCCSVVFAGRAEVCFGFACREVRSWRHAVLELQYFAAVV